MEEQLPLADIPQGFFEYKASFKEPIFDAWYSRHNVLKEIYSVLTPWGIQLDRVSSNEAPHSLKDFRITFAVVNPNVVVSIGLGELTMIANDANWSEAATLVSLFQTVLSSVLHFTNASIESQQTIVGFHLKPGPKPFREILQQFVNVGALSEHKVSMIGVGLYSPEFSLIVDVSAALSNGLFVKITRVFPVATTFQEMASILWKDEEGLLQRLGFRVPQ